jgi:hypothetical protein
MKNILIQYSSRRDSSCILMKPPCSRLESVGLQCSEYSYSGHVALVLSSEAYALQQRMMNG